jgi:hypothetical protein
MVEAYGVVDYDQSLVRMKRTVDWLAALGMNLINDNTMIYSLQGFRKRRVSGKTFTTPWFSAYGQFSEHVGRVCWMTTVGEAVDDVAILYPTMTGWALYGGKLPGSLEGRIWPTVEQALVETTDALNRIQRGWKFLFEEDLAAARVDDGRLVTDRAAFTTVILPGVAAMTEAAYGPLRAFAQAGGQVVLVGVKPCLTPDHGWDVGAAVERLLENSAVTFLEQPDWGAAYRAWLDQRIGSAPFSFDGAGRHQILVAQRRDADHDFAFVSNQAEQPAEIAIRSSAVGAWELWDPDTGDQWALEASEGTDGRCWAATLAPMQSIFVAISRDGGQVEGFDRAYLAGQEVSQDTLLGGVWEFQPLSRNMVRLDPTIRPDPDGTGDAETWRTGAGEWLPTLDGRTELKLDPDEMAYFWVRAGINLAYLPADLELVVDSRDYGQVFVNGYALSGGHSVTIWDEDNWAYPLSDYVFRGRNVIVLRCRPSKYYADRVAGMIIDPNYIEPLMVQGSFAAFPDDGGGHLVVPETGQIRLGAWEDQGYPALCGTGVYRRRLHVPDVDGHFWLVLDDARHAAEVIVNSTSVGIRPWPPYEFEIGEHLRPGENDLVIHVTNNFGRLIRHSYTGLIEHAVLSGLIGKVRLVRTVQ